MITREQYEEALKIIEQYEFENMPDLEDEEYDDYDDEDDDDPLQDEADNCHCGAYQFSGKLLRHIKVADCCC